MTVRAGVGLVVNDVHSRLNETSVSRIVRPLTVDVARDAIRAAARDGLAVSVAGARHAMGGQQFVSDGVLLDLRGLDQIRSFDPGSGLVDVGAGITWPALVRGLRDLQGDRTDRWSIIQKQTGADRLTLGGALAANAHGRGLAFAPIVGDVERFELLDADGELHRCDRSTDGELFRLAIGGYGLVGAIVSVTLRLAPLRKLERIVELADVDDVAGAVEQRVAAGFRYGDLQCSIDPDGDDFLRRGIFSCYRPLPDDATMPAEQRALSADDWKQLLLLAHVDKRRAVDAYIAHYRATSGQRYWSDLHQLADYVDEYHSWIDARLGSVGSEVITELYVPRSALPAFLADCRRDFRAREVNAVYTTIRFIEPDRETFLPWAKQRYACVIFNIHTPHTAEGIGRSAVAFRALIDRALERDGSFFLTYHRFATREQVEHAYPRFAAFLAAKRRVDPGERFQSEWYRHMRALFA